MGDPMKTVTAIAGAALLVLAAPASGAGKTREASEEYSMASGAVVSHGEVEGGEVHWSAGSHYAKFRAERAEKFVTLAVEDAAGGPVLAHAHIDRNGDGDLDQQVDFCGETSEPIAVTKGSVVEVGAIFGMCDESTPSIVTEGTITATFTR
jgi:hypothetical protein